MLQIVTKESNNKGRRADDTSNLSMPLASAIRSISAMLLNNASCDDISVAAVQCMVSMLPGCNAMLIDVQPGNTEATVLASINAPFVDKNDSLPVGPNSLLREVLNAPSRCHLGDGSDIAELFPLLEIFSGGVDDVLVLKVISRPGQVANVMIVVTEPGMQTQAETALMALSELLHALCAARQMMDIDTQSQFAINLAKIEWEATVDILEDLVCLVDGDRRVIRTNRTVERWKLGTVKGAIGMTLHELLHPNCRAKHCCLGSAIAAKITVGAVGEFTIADELLERVLRIQHQPADGMFDAASVAHDPSTVVVVSDITELHRAQAELAALNKDLERMVRGRTEALEDANVALTREIVGRRAVQKDLKESRDELARLSKQLMSAQEDERTRLSRELHDSIGQSLAAVKYTLERLLVGDAGRDEKPDKQILQKAIAGVAESAQEMRRIAMSLRPPALDDMGVTAAVQWLVGCFSDTYPDMQFCFDASLRKQVIPEELSTPIYRISQEALNNAAKHSSASEVLVNLRMDAGKLFLEVVDDGCGFDAAAHDTGIYRQMGNFGWLGMRERALNSGGVLVLESTPGEGTKVIVEWSLGIVPPGQEK